MCSLELSWNQLFRISGLHWLFKHCENAKLSIEYGKVVMKMLQMNSLCITNWMRCIQMFHNNFSSQKKEKQISKFCHDVDCKQCCKAMYILIKTKIRRNYIKKKQTKTFKLIMLRWNFDLGRNFEDEIKDIAIEFEWKYIVHFDR